MMAGKKFQKRREDFCCERCGTTVRGDGYTNHCPRCLWSKHVDVSPGDRAAGCGGLMKPVFLEKEAGVEKLTHRCLACGHTQKNRAHPADDFEAVLKLARRLARS